MALPPISPTGSMASGDYVAYMMDYVDYAMDSVEDDLESYLSKEVFDGWEEQWNRQVIDISTAIDDLETRISKVRSKIRMASDAISRL